MLGVVEGGRAGADGAARLDRRYSAPSAVYSVGRAARAVEIEGCGWRVGVVSCELWSRGRVEAGAGAAGSGVGVHAAQEEEAACD